MVTAPAPCLLSPCFCKRGNYPAAWKIKLFSFAKGCPSKHRAIFTACFFSHQLLLPLKSKKKQLNQGIWMPSVTVFLWPGRERRPRCWAEHSSPGLLNGRVLTFSSGKVNKPGSTKIEWLHGTKGKIRSNQEKKKKREQEAKEMREIWQIQTHRAKPPRGCSLALKLSTWKKRRIYFFLNWNVCIIVTFNST